MADKDNTPLTFGKYKNELPSVVADNDPDYIVWLYENVNNPPVSMDLYHECLDAVHGDLLEGLPDDNWGDHG